MDPPVAPKQVMDVAPPKPPVTQHLPVKPAPMEDAPSANPQPIEPAAPLVPPKPPVAERATSSLNGVVILTVTTMITLSALAILAYLKS